jgi:hypothetical protein
MPTPKYTKLKAEQQACETADEPKTVSVEAAQPEHALFAERQRVRRKVKSFISGLDGASPRQHSRDAPALQLRASDLSEQAKTASAADCLCKLMDSAPGSRQAFRHLANVERSLKSKDADGLFLFDLSAVDLKQALRQLDGLWMAAGPAALVDLRRKIADALAVQDQSSKEILLSTGTLDVLSSFLVDEKMLVSDGRASDFHRLNESWSAETVAAKR